MTRVYVYRSAMLINNRDYSSIYLYINEVVTYTDQYVPTYYSGGRVSPSQWVEVGCCPEVLQRVPGLLPLLGQHGEAVSSLYSYWALQHGA